jgi:hypothetical protein
MFSNPIANRPTGERRWTTWVVAAVLHIVAVYLILTVFNRAGPDTIEIISEPILLEDEAPPLITKPDGPSIKPER